MNPIFPRPNGPFFWRLWLIFCLCAAFLPTGSLAASSRNLSTDPPPAQPVIVDSDHNDLSPSLQDLAQSAAFPAPAAGVEIPLLSLGEGRPSELAPSVPDRDASLQSLPSAVQAMPAPLMNFEGIGNVSGVTPPDTQGDIGFDPLTGRKYYVQWVNLAFAVWDVTSGQAGGQVLLLGPLPGNTLWKGFGGDCELTNSGDPITLFDSLSQRWFMSQFAIDNPYYQCIAVSKTADPTGEWYRYAFEWVSGSGEPVMNDYPKFGVWPDAYYMTVNEFTPVVEDWAGTGAAAFEREKMLQGLPARMVFFDLGPEDWGGMLPSDLDGSLLPPPGSPNYFVEAHADEWPTLSKDELVVYAFHVNWNNPAASTFTQAAALPTSPFDGDLCGFAKNCLAQPGTSQRVDAISDRLMYRLAYRNFGGHESMVVNLTVDANGADQAGIRWFELRRSGAGWSIYQQSTYAPDALNHWMGSIAMDHDGNIALGYNAASSTVYPSIRYTGRLAGDPLNQMSQGEMELAAGTSSASAANRWGDYSMLSIDPQDDCTFWYTQEYYHGQFGTNWKTRIGSFRFSTCQVDTGILSGTVRTANGAAPLAGAQVRASQGSSYQMETTTDENGRYALSLIPGLYQVEAHAYGYQPGVLNDVQVTAGQTMGQDFTLNPALDAVLTGVVRDSESGWPLYAQINPSGYPGEAAWTDPLTGQYTITLSTAVTYTLNVSAWQGVYIPAAREVSLSGDRSEDFDLLADPAACSAPGRRLERGATAFTESFDTGDASLGPNWVQTIVADDIGPSNHPAWSGVAAGTHPVTTPQGGSRMAMFNSFMADAGDSARLEQVEGIDLSYLPAPMLSLWVYHSASGTPGDDQVQIQVQVGDTQLWVSVGPAISREDGSQGWKEHLVDLSAFTASAGQPVKLGLLGLSGAAQDLYVDSLRVFSTACVREAGGLVQGQVFDANFPSLPLTGALVDTTEGRQALAQPTPLDPAVGEAFYQVFMPVGSGSLTATMPGGYAPLAYTVNVIEGQSARRDFALPAGLLNLAAESLTFEVGEGGARVVPLGIENNGGAALSYEVFEINAALPARPLGPFAAQRRHISPKHLDDTDASHIYPHDWPSATALAGGNVIDTWAVSLAAPWGIGVDPHNLWVGDLALNGGTDQVYEYGIDGTPSGAAIDISSWVQLWGADLTYNPFTKSLWQVNVGSVDCIYELDPLALRSTGRSICPPVGVSQRGLAFDPLSNTYYSGSWNNGVIYQFDPAGQLLRSISVGLDIAGLAFNPETQHLFVLVNADFHAHDVYVLDAANGLALFGAFDILGMGDYQQAGLEIDCSGRLWAVNSSTKSVFLVDSGETGACGWQDVPWLSVDPASGVLASAETSALQMHLAAPDGAVPGSTYTATLRITSSEPLTQTHNLQVVMKVVPPVYGAALGGERKQSGAPGNWVTYTLAVTNTGNSWDIYSVTLGTPAWLSSASLASVGPLEGGANAQVSISVYIPPEAQVGEQDELLITITSMGSPAEHASLLLTTQSRRFLYFPAVWK